MARPACRGPGAHGRLTGEGGTRATRQIAGPEAWLAAVEARGHGSAEDRVLGAEERAREVAMMGLRLREGLALSRLGAAKVLDEARVARLLEAGFLMRENGCLRATAKGRPVLNALLAEILA